MLAQFSLCKKLNLLNSLCFPCLEKLTAKFPVFPVPWPPCISLAFLYDLQLGKAFFICWITFPVDPKNQDIGEKRQNLVHTLGKILVFGVGKDHRVKYDFKTLFDFGKLCKNYDTLRANCFSFFFLFACLFFGIPDLNFFSWCNVPNK